MLAEISYTPPPSVLAGAIGLQALYWLSVGRYRDRFRRSAPVPRSRQAAFTAGVLLLLLALASPLDELADSYLFTAHMLQHLLLTLAVAPLLLAGTPGWLLVDLLRSTGLLGLLRWARHPLVAFGVFNLAFSLSHLPQVYELALANEPLHAFEHLLFLATALLMWMPVLSPAPEELPRYHSLGQILYMALQAVPSSLVGAMLSGAEAPFYTTYALAPRLFAIGPLADQQLGGLIMWIGNGMYMLAVIAVIFFAWASREEAADRRPIATGYSPNGAQPLGAPLGRQP